MKFILALFLALLSISAATEDASEHQKAVDQSHVAPASGDDVLKGLTQVIFKDSFTVLRNSYITQCKCTSA
jgi:hypothetical protein